MTMHVMTTKAPASRTAGDIIFIEDLRIDTIIGIYDWERNQKQTISLDLEMRGDISAAALTDSIDNTLNYKAVAKRLIGFIEHSEFQLVETMAERCAEIVLNEFAVNWLRLKIQKPGAVRGARSVGVIIERQAASRAVARISHQANCDC